MKSNCITVHHSDLSYDDLSRNELELLLCFNVILKNSTTNIREIKYLQRKIEYIKTLIK